MKIESEDTSNESLCKYFSVFKTIIYERLSHLFFQEKGKFFKFSNLKFEIVLMLHKYLYRSSRRNFFRAVQ